MAQYKRKKYYKNRKRKSLYDKPRGRRHRFTLRRFSFLLVLLLAIASYAFPTQTGMVLQQVESVLPAETALELRGKINSMLPAGFRLSDLLAREESSGPGSDVFEVHFLDVGQGLSVLVRSGDHTLLYDGGDRDYSSFVVSYLQRQGIDGLDYLIASHYDSDHINGLIGALHVFSVDKVLGPDYEHDSNTYQSFQNAVQAQGLNVTHPEIGTVYPLGDSTFTVLSPSGITDDSNNNSLAIRLVNGSTSFLLSGDAEKDSEEAMCYSGLNLKSDVICPGHHGSSTATSALFLQYTQPTYAVISCGLNNEYGHPHSETLQRLAQADVQVMRTDQAGTIIAYSDGSEISWDISQ